MAKVDHLIPLLKEHADLSIPLAAQLGKLFTIAPWSKQVHAKKSWNGRAATCLRTLNEKKTVHRKIRKHFAKAIHCLTEDQSRNLDPVLAQRIREFMQGVSVKERSLKNLASPIEALSPLSEIQQVKQNKKERKKQEREASIAQSLLRDSPSQEESKLSPIAKLKTLMISGHSPVSSYLDLIEEYLIKHPEKAVAGYQEKLAVFKQSLVDQETRHKVFNNRAQPLSDTEKELMIAEFADEMQQAVHNLAPNEKKLICLSYGKNITGVETFLETLDSLPEEVLSQFPPDLLDMLRDGAGKENVATHYFSKWSTFLSTEFPNLVSKSAYFGSFSPLFSDDRRQMPQWLEQSLPKLMSEFFETRLKEGPLVSLSKLLPSGPAKSLLALAGTYGNLIHDKEYCEKSLTRIFDEGVDKFLPLNAVNKIVQTLPLFLQKLLGLAHGPLWLEVEKKEDGTLNLNVSSLGEALEFHAAKGTSQEINTTLSYQNIQPEKMSQGFFDTLLREQLSKNSSCETFYQDLFTSLNGEKTSQPSHAATATIDLPSSPEMLASKLLFNVETSKFQEVLFEMKLEAYLNYCRSLQHEIGGAIRHKNRQSKQNLKELTELFEAELKKFPEKATDPRIVATLNEVHFSYKSLLKSSSYFKTATLNLGITKKDVEQISSLIEFGGGEELGEVFDNLFKETYEKLPSKAKKVPLGYFENIKSLIENSLKCFFKRSYIDICWDIGRMALIASSLHSGGTSYLIPLAWPYLYLLLPKEIIDSLNRLKAVFISMAAELIRYIVWSTYLDETKRSHLLEKAIDFSETLTQTKQTPLSLTISTPLLKPESELSQPNYFKPWSATYQTTPLLHNVIPAYAEIPSFLPNFHEKVEPIVDENTLVKALTHWNSVIDKIRMGAKSLSIYSTLSLIQSNYLTHQLSQLPLPSIHEPDFWSQINNKKVVCDLLKKLYLSLKSSGGLVITGHNIAQIIYSKELLGSLHSFLCFKNEYSKIELFLSSPQNTLFFNDSLQTPSLLSPHSEVIIGDPNLYKKMQELSKFIKFLGLPRSKTNRISTKFTQDKLNSPENFKDIVFITKQPKPILDFNLRALSQSGKAQLLMNNILQNAQEWNALGSSASFRNLFNEFSHVLFGGGFLENELSSNPQFINVLAEFFHEALVNNHQNKLFNNFLSLCVIGSKCSAYCEKVIPGASHKLPDFNQNLKQLLSDQGYNSKYGRIAAALSIHLPSYLDNRTASNRLAAYLCRNLNKEDQHVLIRQLYPEIHQQYVQTVYELKTIFEDEKSRSFIINVALNHLQIEIPLDAVWDKESDEIYTCLNFKLDLNLGSFQGHIAQTAFKNILAKDLYLKELLGKKGIEALNIQPNHNLGIVYQSNDYVVELKSTTVIEHGFSNIHFEYNCTKLIDGVAYKLMNIPIDKINPVVFEGHDPLNFKVSVWRSETQVYLTYRQRGKELDACSFFPYVHGGDNTRIFLEMPCEDLVEVPPALKNLELHQLRDQLKGLQYLCPLTEISCNIYEGSKAFHSFTLNNLKLTFSVQETPAGLKAFGVQPGYFISDTKTDPALNIFKRYLILENQGGQRAALIIKPDIKAALFSRLSHLAGKMEPYFVDLLSKNSDFYHSNQYIVVSLNDNPLMPLQTEKIEDLTYLFFFYTLEGKVEQAENICQSLEKRLRSEALTDNQINALQKGFFYLSFLPMEFENILHAKARILSLIQSNFLFPAALSESPPEEKISSFEKLVLASGSLKYLYDILKAPTGINKLSQNQEYFLYQYAFNNLRQALCEYGGLTNNIRAILDKLGWDKIFQSCGLTPELFERYKVLKERAGREDTLVNGLYDFAVKVAHSSGTIAPIYQAGSEAVDPFASMSNAFSSAKLANLIMCMNKLHKIQKILQAPIRLKDFRSKIKAEINLNPTLQNITADQFINDFVTYYALAKGDLNFVSFPKTQLQLLKNKCDFFTKTLIEIVIDIHQNPYYYAETSDLISCLAEDKWRELKPERELPKSEFGNFMESLTNKAKHRYVALSFIDPVLKMLVVSTTLQQLASSQPIQADESLVQIGYKSLQSAFTNPAYSLIYPYVPSLTQNPHLVALFYKTLENPKSFAGAKMALLAGGAIALPKLAKGALSKLLSLVVTTEVAGSNLVQIGAIALPIVSAACIYHFAPKSIPSIHLRTFLPFQFISGPALRMGVKTYRAFKAIPPAKIHSLKIVAQKPTIDFQCLIQEECQINNFFQAQFARVFVEKETLIDLTTENKAPLYRIQESDTAIVRDKFEKANKSLEAYYKDTSRNLSRLHINDKAALSANLQHIFLNMTLFEQSFSSRIETEIKDLMSLLKTKMTYSQLHKALTKKSFKQSENLSDEDISLLELAVGRLDYRLSRLHQAQRVVQSLKQLIKITDADLTKSEEELLADKKYCALLDNVATELLRSTQFSFITTPPDLLKSNIVFQAFSQNMLHKGQTATSLTVHTTKNSNVSVQAAGAGKTHYFLPNAAALESDQGSLAVTIIPRQLAGTVLPQISSQLLSIYNKASWTLHFSRDVHFSSVQLGSIYSLMKGALRNGEPLMLTKEVAQSLASMLVEGCYRHEKVSNTSENKKSMIYMHRMLKLLKTVGISLPDETHEIFNFRQMLNFPIGAKIQINKERYLIAEKVIALMTEDEELFSYIQNNRVMNLDADHYQNVIVPRIAAKLSYYEKLSLESEQREEFALYISEKGRSIPVWMLNNTPLFEKCSLIKGYLSGKKLFGINFKEQPKRNYSATEGKEEFAGPNDGNSYRSIGDSIKSPYETLFKTFMLYLVTGLSEAQCKNLLDNLFLSHSMAAKKAKISFKETRFWKRYGSAFTMTQKNGEMITTVDPDKVLALVKDTKLIMEYVKRFILPSITYYEETIENDPFFFTALFQKHISCTATPYNSDTYATSLKTLDDPKILGEMLHIVHQKTAKDGIHILESEGPTQVLEEMLLRFFPSGKPFEFGMIVDGGALFTGIPNRTVASVMMNYFERNNADIHSVKFYDKNEEGEEEVFCFTRGSHKPRLAQGLDLASCVTYYSERQGFGANLPQVKNGLLTLGSGHAQYRILQQFFRNRGTRVSSRLVEAEGFDQVTNSFVMTKQIQKLVLKNQLGDLSRKPTLLEILEYTLREESKLAEEENFPALVMQMRSIAKKVAYHKILSVDSDDFSEWLNLFNSFQEFFITKNEVNPIALFGLLNAEKPTQEVLESISRQIMERVQRCEGFSADDIAQILNELVHLINSDARPPLTETVSVLTDGSEIRTHAVSVTQTEKQNMTQKQQLTEKLNLQQVEKAPKVTKFYHEELPMPYVTHPADLKWLNFSDAKIKGTGVRGFFSYLSNIPSRILFAQTSPFFKLKEICAESPEPVISRIAKDIDSRLWASNNFIPRHIRTGETPIEIGSKYQYRLNQVLVHFKNTDSGIEILHVGALSLVEADKWKNDLVFASAAEGYWDSCSTKTILWDVASRSFQAGFPIDQMILRASPDFNRLIIQLKILEGDPNFTHELPFLKTWLSEQKSNSLAVRLKAAYDSINKERGVKMNTPISALSDLFRSQMICPDDSDD